MNAFEEAKEMLAKEAILTSGVFCLYLVIHTPMNRLENLLGFTYGKLKPAYTNYIVGENPLSMFFLNFLVLYEYTRLCLGKLIEFFVANNMVKK